MKKKIIEMAKYTYFALSLLLVFGMNFEHPWTFLALVNFIIAALVLKTVEPEDPSWWK